MDNIYSGPILLGDVWKQGYQNLVVVSPDVGGVVRARALAKRLECRSGDHRQAASEAERGDGDEHHRRSEGRTCVIIDDMVDTANTLCEARWR